MRGTTQVGQYTSMVVDMHVCVERHDTGRSVYKHGSRHVCVERYDTGRPHTHVYYHACLYTDLPVSYLSHISTTMLVY